jgi:hypothetical protein
MSPPATTLYACREQLRFCHAETSGQTIQIRSAPFILGEDKMKAQISIQKKITAILVATLGFLAADALVTELFSLSTESLVAGLVLSILFFPVIFFAVVAPIYNYVVSDHHPKPSRAS